MLSPTTIYGPDGSVCKKGAEIPAAWFDELPDLQAHLDSIEQAPVIDQAAEPPATDAAASPAKVRARATLGRERGAE